MSGEGEDTPDDSQFRSLISDAEANTKASNGRKQGDSYARRLQDLCKKEDFGLFCTSNKEGYGRVKIGNHHEIYAINSTWFRMLLRKRYYDAYNQGIPDSTLDTEIRTLESRAIFKGEQHDVFLRIAGDGKTWIEIDLGTPEWTSVHINIKEEMWKVKEHKARFFRSPSMKPFPIPVHGGDVREFQKFTNVKSPGDYALFCGFIVRALYPTCLAPYPVAVLQGEHGSAKSTHTKFAQMLIDPSASNAERNVIKNYRDVPAAAENSHFLAYGNIEYLTNEIITIICQLADGAGFPARKLHTDKEELLNHYRRVILLNGITDFATRADLLDRAVFIRLSPITEEQRKTPEDFDAEWAEAWPRIFGAFLDAVLLSLKRRTEVSARLKKRTRTASYMEIAIAAEPAFGVREGTVEETLMEQRDDAHALVLDVPWIPLLLKYLRDNMSDNKPWDGTAGELHAALLRAADEATAKTLPRTPKALSVQLALRAPALRKGEGIELSKPPRRGNKRGLRFSTVSSDQRSVEQSSFLDEEEVSDAPGSGDAGMTDPETAHRHQKKPITTGSDQIGDAGDAQNSTFTTGTLPDGVRPGGFTAEEPTGGVPRPPRRRGYPAKSGDLLGGQTRGHHEGPDPDEDEPEELPL